MFNNKVQKEKSEFEKFMEGQNNKLKLFVGKRVYIKYSFFIQENSKNKIVDVLSLISSNYNDVLLNYSFLQPEKSNVKVNLEVIFEGLPIREKDCFLNIAQVFFNLKGVLDLYTVNKFPKLFSVSGLFDEKKIDWNSIFEFDEEKSYYEKNLPTSYSKYTNHVNYKFEKFRCIILFEAYSGSIDKISIFEIYYEIVNTIISFNNKKAFRIKG